MKLILSYLGLLVFIALVGGYVMLSNPNNLSTPQMFGVAAGLVLYTIILALVGEEKKQANQSPSSATLANRAGLTAALVVFTVGAIVQLFAHHIDYWLLSGLIIINVTKIVSLIYLNTKK